MKPRECRYLNLPGEFRALGELGKSPLKIEGKALIYGTLSEVLCVDYNEWRETFRPGVFTKALTDGADVRFLVNHDPSRILGRNTAGTLQILDDPDALRYSLDVDDTTDGIDTWKRVKRGDMTGVSFHFYCQQDDWRLINDMAVREVIEADIDDISIVTYPAFPDSTAAARSLEQSRLMLPARFSRRSHAERLIRLAEAE